MRMKMESTSMTVTFESKSQNESFARIVIAGFVAGLDPTLEELADIKTAVSEAVTNSIIHGYGETEGEIVMGCNIHNRDIEIWVEDFGTGIEDIEKAKEPLYTTKPEWERSGMGFSFMEAFMDELLVESTPGKGTKIFMKKAIS